MDCSGLSKILEIYYKATYIPILFMNQIDSILFHYPNNMDFNTLMNLFDFEEIIEYVNSLFSRKEQKSPTKYDIFHTSSFFTYTVIITRYESLAGVIVSGPIPVTPINKIRIGELLAHNKLPFHKIAQLHKILDFLPHMSTEQTYHYSKLLLILLRSGRIEGEMLPEPEIHNNWVQTRSFQSGTLSMKANTYKNNYELFLNIRDQIIHGNMEGVDQLLNDSLDALWDTGTHGNIFKSLKIKYLFLCTYSCITSIQCNAPYDRIAGIFNHAVENMDLWETSDDIVTDMILVVKACVYMVSTYAGNHYSLHVNRAMKYIRNHYSNSITLEMLAEYTQVNPVYLSSLIKKETTLSLSDNINKVRIEESCNLLINTNKSISEIGFSVGFNYQNHFCRVFKKITGLTPLEFRAQNQLTPEE